MAAPSRMGSIAMEAQMKKMSSFLCHWRQNVTSGFTKKFEFTDLYSLTRVTFEFT